MRIIDWLRPTWNNGTLEKRSWNKLFCRIYVFSLCLITVVFISFFIPGSSIKCVQCSSDLLLDCIDNPPPPSPCYKDKKFCMIVRMLQPKNGTLLSLSRSCTQEDMGSTCEEAKDESGNPTKVCYMICNTDGCNSGSLPRPQMVFILIIALTMIFMTT